jgi:hypothetical protein
VRKSREPGNLPRAVVLLSVGVRRELRYYRGDDSGSRCCGTNMPSPVQLHCPPAARPLALQPGERHVHGAFRLGDHFDARFESVPYGSHAPNRPRRICTHYQPVARFDARQRTVVVGLRVRL